MSELGELSGELPLAASPLSELSCFDRNRGAASPTSIGVEQGLSPCLVSLSSPVEACLCQGELPASELQRGRASCANSYVIGGRLQPGLLSDA